MDKEELIKFLKENLKVGVQIITSPWSNYTTLEVTLKLGEEEISKSSEDIYIPE